METALAKEHRLNGNVLKLTRVLIWGKTVRNIQMKALSILMHNMFTLMRHKPGLGEDHCFQVVEQNLISWQGDTWQTTSINNLWPWRDCRWRKRRLCLKTEINAFAHRLNFASVACVAGVDVLALAFVSTLTFSPLVWTHLYCFDS